MPKGGVNVDNKNLQPSSQINHNTNSSKGKVVSTYREVKIGKTLYRVTSVYLGKIDLQRAIEDYTVHKILIETNDSSIK